MSFQLSKNGYWLNSESNIWMRADFSGIAYSDGDEVEQHIATVIEQANDLTVLSTELRQHCLDWASLYHLSSTRANLLRPFEGTLSGANVLEIGAGCGAITRYLGECGGNVLALEGSVRRASIARSRTRDMQNVTVLAERFDDFQFEQKFDVITLIGVLEYANLFSKGDQPALAMLNRAISLLKPNGKLIVAIENQLGLKYFAGAPEDHIGQAMYGVEGRYRKDQPQTYGRKVLADMLKHAGFMDSEFMAPFPDYKMPVSIITEAGFSCDGFDAAALALQSVRRDPQLPTLLAFSPELTWPVVFENGVALDVANSFLIVASANTQRLSDSAVEVLAYHYSTDRLPQYCKETRFELVENKDIEVVYHRLAPCQHEHIVENSVIHFDFPVPYAYRNGKAMSWDFFQIVTHDGWKIKDVGEFLRRYISVLEYLLDKDGLTMLLSSPEVRLPGKYFDLIPTNIIILKDGMPVAIDMEWSLRDDVELGHLLFRGLLWMQGSITRFGQSSNGRTYSRIEFVQSVIASAGFNLTEKEFNRFIDIESIVQEEVTGRSACEFFEWYPKQTLPNLNFGQALVERNSQINSFNQTVAELNQTVAELNHQIAATYKSTSWRVTLPLRMVAHQAKRVRRAFQLLKPAIQRGGGLKGTLNKAIKLYRREGLTGIKRGFRIVAASIGSNGVDRNDYAEWVRRYDTITDETRTVLRARIDIFERKPLISVLMPTYNPKPEWLKAAIESVRSQIYPHWELCIADDASTDKTIRPLLDEYAKADSRIKVVCREKNGHISAASNSALELATGEWVALLDHDDLLSEHALFWVADAINNQPQARLIYSDEDKIDESGLRAYPYFKCDWNVDLCYSHNLITHLGVYQTELLHKVGGFRQGFEGSQDYDLALRCIERIEPEQIYHIPRILYHWRMHADSTAQSGDSKTYALVAGERALNEHIQRNNLNAKAELLNFGMYRVRYALPDTLPMVSLIIPTRNGLRLIRQCIESILKKTTYPNYEILIVDNGSDDIEAIQYFSTIKADDRVRVLRDDGPFNYSAINNAAVKVARGELIGLVNNDIEVISPDWLSEMVSHALRPGVGAVGAKLLYPNNTLQHGGVILGLLGVAGHSHKHIEQNQHGYFGRANLIQSLSAVTAACLVVSKSIYEDVGGLNETDLQVAFNDVDFCLRLREAGYRNVWTPYAELYHHESATRGFEDTPEKQARFSKEIQFMKHRWGAQLLADPAYSPNLTVAYEDFSLAWPPRL